MPPTGVCGQRDLPPQSSPGRAGAAAPRGEMGRIPLLGSEGLSCGDRDTVPAQGLPLPTPGTANAACPQVTPPFSQQGLSPKSSPCASHPGAKGQPGSGAGGRAGHPWGRGEVTGRGGGRARGDSALLTPPEKFPRTSQTCWNCCSSQFWRCRRIPARGLPPGSAAVMGSDQGSALAPRHTVGCSHGGGTTLVTLPLCHPPCHLLSRAGSQQVPKFEVARG